MHILSFTYAASLSMVASLLFINTSNPDHLKEMQPNQPPNNRIKSLVRRT
jgi:hypothetical protein